MQVAAGGVLCDGQFLVNWPCPATRDLRAAIM